MRNLLLLIVLTTSALAAQVTVEENVTYASTDAVALHLDIYKPTGQSTAFRPAIVLIHGGAWSSLDKSTMRGMGNFLARSGFVSFAVDYRLLDATGNRWPAQLDDVQSAVRWIRANAAKYNVNPDRVGAFGHSAGAQLAALLGMEDKPGKYSSKVQAVVDVSGPADFTSLASGDADGLAFLARFFGVDYAKHPEVWRNASPALLTSKDNSPFLIVHGTQDREVPIAQSEELYANLKAAGVPVSFVKVDDEHTFKTPEARHQLTSAALEFFNRYLLK